MKALFLISNLEVGGAQRMMVDLLRGLDRARVKPVLALSRKSGAFAELVPRDCLIYDLGRESRWDFPARILQFSRIIRSERPEAIVSALFESNILALLARRWAGCATPLVLSEHSSELSFKTRPAWARWAMRNLYRKADAVVAVSSGLAAELSAHWGVAKDRVRLIHNPIPIDELQALAKAAIPERLAPRTVVGCGRLERRKGFHVLLEALALLDPDIRLVLVGDGIDRPALEERARRPDLQGRVRFIGADLNPYRWMARAAVFAFPSLTEGFGIALAEALALGIPAVASDCRHGPAEILEGGRCGILVPPGNPVALAGAIRHLLAEPRLAEGLAHAGRERARHFDAPRVARRYEDLLETVTKASRLSSEGASRNRS